MAQHTTEQFLQGFQLSLGIKIILPDGISIETRTYEDMERDKTHFFQNTIKSNIVSTECLEKGKITKLGLVNETLQNCKTALTSKNLPLCFITVMVMVEV